MKMEKAVELNLRQEKMGEPREKLYSIPISSSSSECSAQGQVLYCRRRILGCSSAEGRFSTANSGTKAAVLQGLNRCGSIPLLSASHYLFSIWTDLKRSEKITGAPTWRWGKCIWLTGPSRLHRNSPKELNLSSIRDFDQIRDPENPITLRPHFRSVHPESHISTLISVFTTSHIKQMSNFPPVAEWTPFQTPYSQKNL